ncbi:MAG TPA: Gfo/Idh/MocA family oxidoreductase [Armatimonadota bacterium]|jgi:predicted dehydrogenase
MAVGIGIIGCGAIGQRRHIPEAAANPDCKLVAVCDYLADRSKSVAEHYGCKAFTDYHEMLELPEIDAVAIGIRNDLHASVTIDALKAGKHALCEKPIATTLEEAQEMIDTAASCGKFLMVGHNQRLMPAHVKAKEILRSGKLGKVLTFRTMFEHSGPQNWVLEQSMQSWFFQKDLAIMGATGDLGVHKADLIRWLIDSEVEQVSALLGTLDKKYDNGQPVTVDDNAVCLLKMKSGAFGTIVASWTNYGPESNGTTLNCSKGVMQIGTDPEWGVIVYYSNGNVEKYKIGEMSTNTKQVSSGVMDQFVEAIKNNHKPEISGEEGYRALQIILACMEACRENKVVTLG